MLHAHSGLRWVVLILLLVAIVKAISNIKSGKYGKGEKMINLFAMVFVHIQVTIGIVLAFTSGKMNFAEGWKDIPYTRFLILQHLSGMIVAAVLLTIGRKRAEKQTDLSKRNKQIALWYLISLVIIIASIPWPFKGFGNGWA